MTEWIKNLKITKKLVLIVSVAMAGILAVGLSSWLLVVRMNSFTDEISTRWLAGVDKARDMDGLISDYRLNELRYVTAAKEEKRAEADRTMADLKTQVDSLISTYERTVSQGDAQDANLIAAVKSGWQDYLNIHSQTANLVKQNKAENAIQLMDSQGLTSYNALDAALKNLVSYNSNGAYQAADDSNDTYRMAVIILLIVIIAVVLICSAVGAVVGRVMLEPVKEIEGAAIQMAQGDLDVELGYQSEDELGVLASQVRELVRKLKVIIEDENTYLARLAQSDYTVESSCPGEYIGGFHSLYVSFSKISDELNETFRQISNTADSVSSGSEQVANGAQALAQGATEQASSVEQLSASINDVSNQVSSNAEAARNASSKVEEVGDGMRISNEKMQEMIAAMADISGSSNEIGKIIKTIEDIAFQTNILALNAAVEAARAGAAGKGFAVVANEVRDLATKSAEASKNTSALIERSIKSVENGTHIADETAKALMKAVQGAQEATEIVNEISEASARQASAIAQITLGIEQISSVVQSNSATSEESAAASQELSSQAHVLKKLVSSVRLKEENRPYENAYNSYDFDTNEQHTTMIGGKY